MIGKTKPLTVASSILAVILFSPTSTTHAQEKILLQYKFDKGESLQYRSESYDSTTTGSGDQVTTTKMIRGSLQTLSVLDASAKNTYKVSIKIDSTWTDQDSQSPTVSSEDRSRMFRRRGPGGPGGRRREEEVEITTHGESVSKDPVASPLLLPLPKDPVSVNDAWEFEKNIENKGRMKGTTHVHGQCLLYDIQKEGDKTRALIIVNTESTGEDQFTFKRQDTEISGSTQRKGATTSLVYFDVDRGRITEIVTEETRDSATESTTFSSTVSTKTKATVKLISE